MTVSLSLLCFTQLYHSLRTVSNDVPEIEGAYQVRPSAMYVAQRWDEDMAFGDRPGLVSVYWRALDYPSTAMTSIR